MKNIFQKVAWLNGRMKLINLFTLTVLSISLVGLSACQSNPAQQASHDSGFGGTGQALASLSGFGGTGKTSSGFGGTGIIGTITGFGSIWVNGIEIGYGTQTQISSNLSTQDTLKRGQQVILETLPQENQTLTKSIHIYYPIAGKITQRHDGHIEIDHQYQIKITPKTQLDAGIQLTKGQYIAVNGYQTDAKNWTATRLNLNHQAKAFYQPIPQIHFSEQVHKVVIEAGLQQFSDWQLGHDLSLPKQRKHMVIEGRVAIHSGKIERFESSEIKPYSEFIELRHQEQMRESHDGMAHQYQEHAQQDLREMHETQKQQQDLREMHEVQSQQQNLRDIQERRD